MIWQLTPLLLFETHTIVSSTVHTMSLLQTMATHLYHYWVPEQSTCYLKMATALHNFVIHFSAHDIVCLLGWDVWYEIYDVVVSLAYLWHYGDNILSWVQLSWDNVTWYYDIVMSLAYFFWSCNRVFFKLFPEGVKSKFLYPFMILNMHLKG